MLGTIKGSTISFGIAAQGVSWKGSITSAKMSGNYATGIRCGNATGNWSASRVTFVLVRVEEPAL